VIHIATCHLCTWKSFWGGEKSAENASAWHVYYRHRNHWVKIIGEDRPPDTGVAPPLRQLTTVTG
jgi:hypothetical protein